VNLFSWEKGEKKSEFLVLLRKKRDLKIEKGSKKKDGSDTLVPGCRRSIIPTKRGEMCQSCRGKAARGETWGRGQEPKKGRLFLNLKGGGG